MSDETQKIAELETKLAKLEQEKASLLKVVSHDVRSPLNKLFALVNLLKMTEDSLTKEQLGYLDKMEMVLSDGLSRMKNLMDLRAIELNEVQTYMEPLDLGVLTAKIIREYTPVSERKNIKVEYEGTHLSTITDRLCYSRILEQILSNAFKFSPTLKPIKVTLTDNDNNIVLAVTDGGYGIKEEEQKDLFRKFKVLSTHTSAGESTTGLGLYIAQWNAKHLGGDITYQNSNGSTFVVTLPKVRMA